MSTQLCIRESRYGIHLLSITIFSALLLSLTGLAVSAEDTFAPLKHRLIEEGFSSQEVKKIYQRQPPFMLKTIAQTLKMRESKLNYDQFLDPPAIAEAQRFASSHQSLLTQAEKTYNVDHRVIVALLLIETHFGSYTGRTPTLAVFSTFALMDQKSNRDKVWAMLSPEDRERLGREAFDRKLLQRSDWAYQELCALLRLSDFTITRVKTVQGSVMGAIGWPQFLPSSLLRYGADGDQDGRVDLFQAADAIFSIANYLRGYGWCEAKDQTAREEVIYKYNHSRPYVEAVLGVASRLH